MADYSELTITELKELLRERMLPVGGRKADLVLRLEDSDPFEEEEVEGELEIPEEPATPEVEVDIMPSETPEELRAEAGARGHYIGPGSVSGEWIFDDVPGSIAANTLEEALEKHRTMPGNLKVKGSH